VRIGGEQGFFGQYHRVCTFLPVAVKVLYQIIAAAEYVEQPAVAAAFDGLFGSGAVCGKMGDDLFFGNVDATFVCGGGAPNDVGVGFTPRLASNGDRFAEDLSPHTDVSSLVESVTKALNEAQESGSDEPFCVVVSGLVDPDEVACLEDICQTSMFANGVQIPDGTVMVAQKATPVVRVEM